MSKGNMKIGRIMHRSKEELTAAAKIAKQTSVADSMCVLRAKLDIQVMVRNGYQTTPAIVQRLKRKHEIMLKYFRNIYADYIVSYDFENVHLSSDTEYQNCIWICWWQGIENAPEIVKACVKSIEKHAEGYKVVIITEENYKNYVSFPAWIETKYKNGVISRTHFSDLLRISLLAEHGGVWLDSTFSCTAPVFDEIFSMPVWSVKRPNYSFASVASGNFANYALGCSYDNRRVFQVIKDFWLHYWEMHDFLIDYLMTDYLIVLVQQSDEKIAALFDAIQPNNPACDDLLIKLGNCYDEAEWQTMKKETSLFKLTWKAAYPSEIVGKETYFGALLNDRL